MTTWVLIVWFAMEYNSSTAMAIPNIKNLGECMRLYGEVVQMAPRKEHSFRCIEVINK